MLALKIIIKQLWISDFITMNAHLLRSEPVSRIKKNHKWTWSLGRLSLWLVCLNIYILTISSSQTLLRYYLFLHVRGNKISENLHNSAAEAEVQQWSPYPTLGPTEFSYHTLSPHSIPHFFFFIPHFFRKETSPWSHN